MLAHHPPLPYRVPRNVDSGKMKVIQKHFNNRKRRGISLIINLTSSTFISMTF